MICSADTLKLVEKKQNTQMTLRIRHFPAEIFILPSLSGGHLDLIRIANITNRPHQCLSVKLVTKPLRSWSSLPVGKGQTRRPQQAGDGFPAHCLPEMGQASAP